jgi:hypothetical protein
MRRRHLFLMLTCLCGLLGGCGGSGSRPATPVPAYIAAGNAICARQVARLNALARPSTPEQAIGYLPHAIAIMRSESNSLAALERPAGRSSAQLSAALDSTRELTDTLARFLHRMSSGMIDLTDFGTVQSRSVALQAQLDMHFRLAGLTRCAD